MTAGEERRFVADATLGRLARYLRMLGYDTVFTREREGAGALREALNSGRTLLTRRRDLAGRAGVEVLLVESDDVAAQLRQVVGRWGLSLTPRVMTLCLECNLPLEDVSKAEVAERLPPHVRKTQERFKICNGCGRIYWPGTHYARAVARLLEIIRRS